MSVQNRNFTGTAISAYFSYTMKQLEVVDMEHSAKIPQRVIRPFYHLCGNLTEIAVPVKYTIVF